MVRRATGRLHPPAMPAQIIFSLTVLHATRLLLHHDVGFLPGDRGNLPIGIPDDQREHLDILAGHPEVLLHLRVGLPSPI